MHEMCGPEHFQLFYFLLCGLPVLPFLTLFGNSKIAFFFPISIKSETDFIIGNRFVCVIIKCQANVFATGIPNIDHKILKIQNIGFTSVISKNISNLTANVYWCKRCRIYSFIWFIHLHNISKNVTNDFKHFTIDTWKWKYFTVWNF